MIRVLPRYKLVLIASLCFSWVMLFGVGRANAFSLPGDVSSQLPNNGSPAVPWSVVTRPGTNGMDAPKSTSYLYIPKSYTDSHSNQFTFTLRDACDNTVNDENPANNDTYFWLIDGQVSFISTSSGGTVTSGPAIPWWYDHLFRCDTGNDSVITATINPSIDTRTINGIEYREIELTALTDKTKTSYYANRFRVDMSNTPGAFSAYGYVLSAPTVADDFTGVAYNKLTPASYEWGWQTRINFAYTCNLVNNTPRKVYFFDSDYHGTEDINPYWQTPTHPMRYYVEKYLRYDGSFAGYATATDGSSLDPSNPNLKLTQGQNTVDSTKAFVMDSNYIYSTVVWNINYINSIQVAIPDPARQIYALDRCSGSQPSLSCSVVGASIEPGNYTPQVSVTYSAPGGSASATFNTTVIVNGASRTVNGTVLAAGGSTTVSGFSPPYSLGAGTFSISASVSGNTGALPLSATCDGATTISVVAKPYFKVFNGGVMVGAGFNSGTTTCTTPGNARVSAFASDSPSFHGASSEYELRSLGGVVKTFYSSGRQPTALPNYKALTLANNAASGTYGGSFGGASCITDYYVTAKNSTVPVASGASTIATLDAAAGANNQVEWGGGTLSGGALAAAEKLAVFVDGDVYINGNITLATNYTSLTDIPFFALVVKGNIKIAPNVTQLDGLYIAQPDGNADGTIYTCLNADNTVPNLYNTCRTKLTFNGAVVAKNLKLLRTAGTLASGPANETAASANIAEVFNGTPEMYIAYPAFRVEDSTTELYDSVTSLPPLL